MGHVSLKLHINYKILRYSIKLSALRNPIPHLLSLMEYENPHCELRPCTIQPLRSRISHLRLCEIYRLADQIYGPRPQCRCNYHHKLDFTTSSEPPVVKEGFMLRVNAGVRQSLYRHISGSVCTC